MMQAARLKQVNLEIEEDTSQPSTALATVVTNGDEESKDIA